MRLDKEKRTFPFSSKRTRNLAGFYSEDWDESQQVEDDWLVFINGTEYLRWCFVADYWKYIRIVQDVYQYPVLNTKEADVAHGKTWGPIYSWWIRNSF